ncbi:MAG: hypothetical protein VYD57_11345 [Pseudomonadota bacterium]|nr:hypothetical protein [Pseudomonadota bacterium]
MQKNELTLELDGAVHGGLCQIAVRQQRLPVQVAEEAVEVYVDALGDGDTVTVGIDLPASTVAMWTEETARHGRTAEREIEIRVLMETIKLGNEALGRTGR